jgi:serine/threonine-protein kinase RsbW
VRGPDFRIELSARPESIGLAREAVASQADRLGMAPSLLGDLRTVAGEAFTNAVRYAYEEGVEGRVEIALSVDGEELRLSVRDFGVGILPRPDSEVPSLGMGLPIIGALSNGFRLSSARGAGTELEIRMPMAAAS